MSGRRVLYTTNLTADDPLDKVRIAVCLLLSNHVVLVREGVAFERDSGSRKEPNDVHVLHHIAQHVGGEEELDEGRLKLCIQYIVCELTILPTGLQPICLGKDLYKQG